MCCTHRAPRSRGDAVAATRRSHFRYRASEGIRRAAGPAHVAGRGAADPTSSGTGGSTAMNRTARCLRGRISAPSVRRSPVSGMMTNVGPFPLGFSFPYYGNDYTAVRFCTNGWISFTSSSTAYSNNAIPSAEEPNNAVYAFWDDLSFSSSGDAYYYFDAAAMEFVVQYTAVPRISGSQPYTFQIVLRPSGEILFYYLDMTGALDGATAGIENADGSVGLQVVTNAAYVHDSLAVRFFLPDAPWLAESPVAGLLPPWGTQPVMVAFDALGLDPGSSHQGLISVDLVHPDVADALGVPVTLQVQPADSALLILSGASIQFPVTALFATRLDTVTARNGGALPLTLSSISSSDSSFSVTPASAVLQPGDSIHIVIGFTPIVAGPDTGTHRHPQQFAGRCPHGYSPAGNGRGDACHDRVARLAHVCRERRHGHNTPDAPAA